MVDSRAKPVPRPGAQRVDRARVVAHALKIIDCDGVQALSLRRLATSLGIEGPSLYYHFRSKDEILTAVLNSALDTIPVLAEDDVEWVSYLVRLNLAMTMVFQQHPHLVSLYLDRAPAYRARVEDRLRWAIGATTGLGPTAIDFVIATYESFIIGTSLVGHMTESRRCVLDPRNLASMSHGLLELAVAEAKQIEGDREG
jgi:AcrR family transcriptional regulator